VAARACLALAASLQLCKKCGGAAREDLAQPQLAAIAQQLAATLQRHAAEPAVAAAGLHLLLRLAGCASCRVEISRQQQDLLAEAGAVPAAAAALALLSAAAQEQHVSPISEGLQALHYLCSCHAGNLAQLASSGGVQTVVAAMAAAASAWPAEEHGLLLLAQLACRQGAALPQQAEAAATIWAAGQAQVERRLVEVGRAAVWGMARVLQRLLPQAAAADGSGGSPEGARLVADLQLQGAAVALAMLQSCDKKVRGAAVPRQCCGSRGLPACSSPLPGPELAG
jgi:hypothetical protein